ncbi:MAG: hypothetical protein U0521_10910 [Anaerolineae bacterium]
METVGTHPAFIDMIGDLIRERMIDRPERLAPGRGESRHLSPELLPEGKRSPARPTHHVDDNSRASHDRTH